MANPNDFMWNLLTGKAGKDILGKVKANPALAQQIHQRYSDVQHVPKADQSFQDPMSFSMYNFIKHGEDGKALDAAHPYIDILRSKVMGQDTQVIKDAKNYKYEIPKIDDSNILYKLPMFETDQPKSPIGGVAAGLGSAGTVMANIGSPDMGLGVASGALKGAGYGAMLGPAGAGIGAVIGGLAGFAQTGLNKSRYEENRLSTEKGKIKSATIYGGDIGQFAQGGQVGGEENELTPIQTEKGEQIILPDMHIYRSAATKLHKQMASDFITDILPPEAIVASNSKRKVISRDKAEKMIIGYDTIEYKEDKQSSVPQEHNLGEIFTKKRMTPAELVNIVKNKFPTNDIEMDGFARKANVLNLQARIPYINAILASTKK